MTGIDDMCGIAAIINGINIMMLNKDHVKFVINEAESPSRESPMLTPIADSIMYAMWGIVKYKKFPDSAFLDVIENELLVPRSTAASACR